jgi:hypothetical protein
MTTAADQDFMYFARAMAEMIKRDGAEAAYIGASGEDQTALVQAYAPAVAKQFERFATSYMTQPAVREAFIKTVYQISR